MRSPVLMNRWFFFVGGALVALIGWRLVHAETQGNAGDDLQIEYARARLALAETTLEQAERINRQVRGAVAANVVDEYRRDVEVARRHHGRLESGRDRDEFALWLNRAEANRRTAEARWKSATKVNSRVRGAFEPMEIRRLELQAKLGQLLVNQGKSLAKAPRESQIAWQLEVLAVENERLSEELQRKQGPSGGYPYYYYY